MQPQSRIQRFDAIFLKDFFNKELHRPVIEEPKAVEEALPPAPTFSEEELADARHLAHQAGYQQGFTEGQEKGRGEHADREKATLEALELIASRFDEINAQQQQALAREQHETTKLALSIARKLVGLHLEHHASEHVNELVARCLPSIMQKPAITLHMHPDLAGSVESQVKAMIESKGFHGQITIVADAQLGPYDVKIAWDQGHIEHNMTRAWSDIQALVEHFSMTPNPTTAPQE